jgi:hypothetical protein
MRRFFATGFGLAAIGLSFSLGAHATTTRPRVHFVGSVAKGQSLVVEGADRKRVVFTLPPWANVETLVVSPSGRHAFVFALLEPHKPRTGFVINLMAGGLDGSFRPGIGGEFFFSPADTVVQTTGCGTSCATLMVHDTSGKTLGNYLCEGFDEDEEMSHGRAFAACFKKGRLEIIDTSTGRAVYAGTTPCSIGRWSVRFDVAREALRFVCYDERVHGDVAVVASWARGRPALEVKKVPNASP